MTSQDKVRMELREALNIGSRGTRLSPTHFTYLEIELAETMCLLWDNRLLIDAEDIKKIKNIAEAHKG